MHRQAHAGSPVASREEGAQVDACDYCRRIGTADTCMLLQGVQHAGALTIGIDNFTQLTLCYALTINQPNPGGDIFWCNTCKSEPPLMCAKWTAASTTKAGQFDKNRQNLCILSLALSSQSDAMANDCAIILAKDSGGRQPLHWSAGSGDPACVWMLLLCGADVLGRDAQVRGQHCIGVSNGVSILTNCIPRVSLCFEYACRTVF